MRRGQIQLTAVLADPASTDHVVDSADFDIHEPGGSATSDRVFGDVRPAPDDFWATISSPASVRMSRSVRDGGVEISAPDHERWIGPSIVVILTMRTPAASVHWARVVVGAFDRKTQAPSLIGSFFASSVRVSSLATSYILMQTLSGSDDLHVASRCSTPLSAGGIAWSDTGVTGFPVAEPSAAATRRS
jgi:hypothetical protein